MSLPNTVPEVGKRFAELLDHWLEAGGPRTNRPQDIKHAFILWWVQQRLRKLATYADGLRSDTALLRLAVAQEGVNGSARGLIAALLDINMRELLRVDQQIERFRDQLRGFTPAAKFLADRIPDVALAIRGRTPREIAGVPRGDGDGR